VLLVSGLDLANGNTEVLESTDLEKAIPVAYKKVAPSWYLCPRSGTYLSG